MDKPTKVNKNKKINYKLVLYYAWFTYKFHAFKTNSNRENNM